MEKDFGVLMHEKMITTWQCALVTQKDNFSWGYIKSSVAKGGYSSPLFYSHKTPPGVQHLASNERQQRIKAGYEESQENCQGSGAPLLRGGT